MQQPETGDPHVWITHSDGQLHCGDEDGYYASSDSMHMLVPYLLELCFVAGTLSDQSLYERGEARAAAGR